MFRRKLICVIAAAAALTELVWAQTPAPAAAPAAATTTAAEEVPEGGVPAYVRAETPEQRRARLGTAEDPGMNPDPEKHFWRFGHSYHIARYERTHARYDREPGMVRPIWMVNFAYEVYQQNEKYVWTWMPDADPEAQKLVETTPPQSQHWGDDQIAFFKRIKPQFEPVYPVYSDKTVKFEESSGRLPQTGSWRNSPAVADMNDDGCPDIVTPPERKGNGFPVIFLGDCKGNWTPMAGTTWPHVLDYGGVVAADFNKDGHMDLAFSVHLNGVYVFLGDGKGHFTESVDGLPHDFPSRRLVAVDADKDGYPDLAVISEGPTAVTGLENNQGVNVRVYLNRNKGMKWQRANVTAPGITVGGDWLSTGDLNGDRRPDFISASVYFNSQDVVQISSGPVKWKPYPSDGDVLPSLSYYFASTTGKFTSKTNDDAIINYERYWPDDLDPRIVEPPREKDMGSVDRIAMTKDGLKRYPIMRWPRGAVSGMASGDFDGDGNLDIVFTRDEPREAVLLLGDGRGGFKRATIDGLVIDDNRNYDLKVADLNGDKLPDVILLYETLNKVSNFNSVTGEKNGSVRVFLNRGPRTAATTAATTR